MGRVLEEAFREASKLPENEQDELGEWVLAELESERRWQRGFARGLDVLEQMAAEALEEHEKGLTLPLDPEAM